MEDITKDHPVRTQIDGDMGSLIGAGLGNHPTLQQLSSIASILFKDEPTEAAPHHMHDITGMSRSATWPDSLSRCTSVETGDTQDSTFSLDGDPLGMSPWASPAASSPSGQPDKKTRLSEKRRREAEKSHFAVLRQLLPDDDGQRPTGKKRGRGGKETKADIIRRTVGYISQLQKDINTASGDFERLLQENSTLRARFDQLVGSALELTPTTTEQPSPLLWSAQGQTHSHPSPWPDPPAPLPGPLPREHPAHNPVGRSGSAWELGPGLELNAGWLGGDVPINDHFYQELVQSMRQDTHSSHQHHFGTQY